MPPSRTSQSRPYLSTPSLSINAPIPAESFLNLLKWGSFSGVSRIVASMYGTVGVSLIAANIGRNAVASMSLNSMYISASIGVLRGALSALVPLFQSDITSEEFSQVGARLRQSWIFVIASMPVIMTLYATAGAQLKAMGISKEIAAYSQEYLLGALACLIPIYLAQCDFLLITCQESPFVPFLMTSFASGVSALFGFLFSQQIIGSMSPMFGSAFGTMVGALVALICSRAWLFQEKYKAFELYTFHPELAWKPMKEILKSAPLFAIQSANEWGFLAACSFIIAGIGSTPATIFQPSLQYVFSGNVFMLGYSEYLLKSFRRRLIPLRLALDSKNTQAIQQAKTCLKQTFARAFIGGLGIATIYATVLTIFSKQCISAFLDSDSQKNPALMSSAQSYFYISVWFGLIHSARFMLSAIYNAAGKASMPTLLNFLSLNALGLGSICIGQYGFNHFPVNGFALAYGTASLFSAAVMAYDLYKKSHQSAEFLSAYLPKKNPPPGVRASARTSAPIAEIAGAAAEIPEIPEENKIELTMKMTRV